MGLLTSNKITVFYMLRCALAILSAACEARFVRRVCAAVDKNIGTTMWLLLLTSAGMFHAAVAFLHSRHRVLLAWHVQTHAHAGCNKSSVRQNVPATAAWRIACQRTAVTQRPRFPMRIPLHTAPPNSTTSGAWHCPVIAPARHQAPSDCPLRLAWWRGCPGTPAPPCTTQGHWPCPCGLQSSQHQPELRDISFA